MSAQAPRPFVPTAEQAKIIAHEGGQLLVLATVGAGKTTTITARIGRLVAEGADPSRVLGLTFTNRAADNLRQAVATLGATVAGLNVRTFHGFCTWVLRQEARAVGLPGDFWIYDEDDAASLAGSLGARDKEFFDFQGEMSAVKLDAANAELYYSARFSRFRWAAEYVRTLSLLGAVDFGGLVLLCRAALAQPEVRARWEGRFDHVSVDEVQDTHVSEYEVLRALAKKARSFVLCGDLDQTIYGWRGSDPARLLAHMEGDFGPFARLPLTENHRSTKALVAYADAVARKLSARATSIRPSPALPAGVPPSVTACADPEAEAEEIARGVALAQKRVSGEKIAVLCRTNGGAEAVSRALTQARVPHATVESYRFFRRQEVKDAMSLLRLNVDLHAEPCARRIALRLLPGVGEKTVTAVVRDGDGVGFRVGDLLDARTIVCGDPLWGLASPDLVVLDTETTGFDAENNDVIEIAATRIQDGRPAAEFHALLRPRGPVGNSAAIHGYTDAHLAAHGRDAKEVMREFSTFVGDLPVCGHNVAFDLRMLGALAERHGGRFVPVVACDTLVAARRLLRSPSYRLGDLVASLGLGVQATHRAKDDVAATLALRAALATLAAGGTSARQRLVSRYGDAFSPLRTLINDEAHRHLRPHEQLARLARDSGLRRAYAAEPERLANLDELQNRISRLDDAALPPRAALRAIVDRAALARDVDGLDDARGVRVITVHQSKGLEFEEVFVPGMSTNNFPSYYAERDGNTEEECRLFYVAVTRARQRLHLTWPRVGTRGYANKISPFLP